MDARPSFGKLHAARRGWLARIEAILILQKVFYSNGRR